MKNIVNNIENNDITELKINDGIVADKDIIGSFVKNSADIEIINLDHKYDNLKGTYIDIQDFGKWYVNELATDEEFTSSKLSLYDITHKFDEDYEDTFTFPATMGEWATWIGDKVGVPLKGTFLNYDLVLTERPYLGTNPKYRDAVKKIAKYASSYARKNYDNTYSICWFEDNITEIEDWEDFVHGNQTPKTNVIVLSTGDTEDNVKYPQNDPKEPHELRIEDEWTNIDRYSINEAIYNQINGFFYTPISKLNIPFGLLNLRPGQKIKTQDIEHKDIETYISKITLEWQGGEFKEINSWGTSIQMEELKETSTKLDYANSFANRILNVERKADKNEGIIEDTVQRVEQNSQDIDNLSNPIKTVDGDNLIHIEDSKEDNAIEYHILGKSEQETSVQGKNLLNIKDFSLTSNGVTLSCSNGNLKVTGNATAGTAFFLKDYINLDEINQKV